MVGCFGFVFGNEVLEIFVDIFVVGIGCFFEVEKIGGIVMGMLIEKRYFFLECCCNIGEGKNLVRKKI